MPAKFKPGLVLACEHIVQGVGGKPTFIGVYTGDIIVPVIPANFWISFFVELLDATALPDQLRVLLTLDGDEFGHLNIETAGIDHQQPVSIMMPSGLLRVDRPAELRVTVSGKGFSNLIAMRKRISVNPDHPTLVG